MKRVSSDDFTLVVKDKPKNPKLIVTVSKKVAKKAVDRNRIKRLILESLRGEQSKSDNLQIVARKNFSNLKMAEVKDKINKLIKKL